MKLYFKTSLSDEVYRVDVPDIFSTYINYQQEDVFQFISTYYYYNHNRDSNNWPMTFILMDDQGKELSQCDIGFSIRPVFLLDDVKVIETID